MTTDIQILDIAITRFNKEFPEKFTLGMRRYSSPIWEKDCLAEAIPEVYDLISYLTVEREKKNRVYQLVVQLRDHYLNNYNNIGNDKWNELEQLLSPKPLATKNTCA